MLSEADIDHFVEDGFVAVRGAFSTALAEACLDLLWPGLGVPGTTARRGPSRWCASSARADPLILQAANAPLLHEAFDQLVGPGRWRPMTGLGTFPVRFPGEAIPATLAGTSTAASPTAPPTP